MPSARPPASSPRPPPGPPRPSTTRSIGPASPRRTCRPGAPAGAADANLQTTDVATTTPGNLTWQRDPLGRWTETLYDALDRPYETIRNYENGNPTTVDAANQGWTDGTDTDLISYTTYNADGTVASADGNYVTGTFNASQPDRGHHHHLRLRPDGPAAADGAERRPVSQSRAPTPTAPASRSTIRSTGLTTAGRDALGRWATTQYDPLARVSATHRRLHRRHRGLRPRRLRGLRRRRTPTAT